MITSQDEHAARFTVSIASLQVSQPALNTSTFRFVAMAVTPVDVSWGSTLNLGVNSRVNSNLRPKAARRGGMAQSCFITCAAILGNLARYRQTRKHSMCSDAVERDRAFLNRRTQETV